MALSNGNDLDVIIVCSGNIIQSTHCKIPGVTNDEILEIQRKIKIILVSVANLV